MVLQEIEKMVEMDENTAAAEGAGAPGRSTMAIVTAPNPSWVSHISYYQDYMTVIELDDGTNPGVRTAS